MTEWGQNNISDDDDDVPLSLPAPPSLPGHNVVFGPDGNCAKRRRRQKGAGPVIVFPRGEVAAAAGAARVVQWHGGYIPLAASFPFSPLPPSLPLPSRLGHLIGQQHRLRREAARGGEGTSFVRSFFFS